jgi:hypothetical protein
MKYIIQIIGGLGLLFMLSMCVQAGMLSQADIQNRSKSAESGSQGYDSDPDAPKGRWEIRPSGEPVMSDKDPTPQDYAKDSGGD